MGEIIGGIVVMAVFIAFVIFKNRNKANRRDPLSEQNEQEYWARKEAEQFTTHGPGSEDDGD